MVFKHGPCEEKGLGLGLMHTFSTQNDVIDRNVFAAKRRYKTSFHSNVRNVVVVVVTDATLMR